VVSGTDAGIAFSAYHSGDGYYRSSVWVMDADGQHLKRVARGARTDNDDLPESLSWQPIRPQ